MPLSARRVMTSMRFVLFAMAAAIIFM